MSDAYNDQKLNDLQVRRDRHPTHFPSPDVGGKEDFFMPSKHNSMLHDVMTAKEPGTKENFKMIDKFFKVGDTVVCTNPDYSENKLECWKTYKVAEVNSAGNVLLYGIDLTFWEGKRFVLVERQNPTAGAEVETKEDIVKFKVGDTVRCIDSNRSAKKLERGKTYIIKEIRRENSGPETLLVLSGVEGSWWIKRFELVTSSQQSTTAIKNDTGKTEYHHLPPQAFEEVNKVLTFGARKYSAYNYRAGFKHSRLFSAAMRHVWAYWRGEDLDPETGLSHLAHACCCMLIMLQNVLESKGTDDRFKGGSGE